jgi:predicted glycosyltransferase
MNIYIDLLHPAHINLFKRLISQNAHKHNFIVTCINRGKVPKIAQEEIKAVPVYIIGKHKGTKSSILFQANFLRFFQLLWFLRNKPIDIGISFGSFLAGAILRLKNKPNIHLSDDPERKINAILENYTCSARYLPPIIKEGKKVKTFKALKEWAYLSPLYFKPSDEVLEFYKLKQKDYVFIREVSTGSLNYSGQEKNIIASIADQLPENIQVVLSLEDKKTIEDYPDHWKILQEPVKDIHSIIYYSKLVISSGDSMAREGAMLGVPSIYCGLREMKANQLLIDKQMMFHVFPHKLGNYIQSVLNGTIYCPSQNEFRSSLLNQWTDVNEFLLKTLEKYDHKS